MLTSKITNRHSQISRINRSPDHPISRSSAPAVAHSLTSVIGGLVTQDEAAKTGPRVRCRKDVTMTIDLIDLKMAVTHFPVIGRLARGHERNLPKRKLAPIRCSHDSTGG